MNLDVAARQFAAPPSRIPGEVMPGSSMRLRQETWDYIDGWADHLAALTGRARSRRAAIEMLVAAARETLGDPPG